MGKRGRFTYRYESYEREWYVDEDDCSSWTLEQSGHEDLDDDDFDPDDEDGRCIAFEDQGCSYPMAERVRFDEMSPQELGDKGESLAAAYLDTLGYEVLERNWTCPFGEADIVAQDDETCVLVEVKTRFVSPRRAAPYPELAVNDVKQRRYRRIAECYASSHAVGALRFDVIAITMETGRSALLRHLKNAFECDE